MLRHLGSFHHSGFEFQEDIIIIRYSHILVQLSVLRPYRSIVGNPTSVGDLVNFANATVAYITFSVHI